MCVRVCVCVCVKIPPAISIWNTPQKTNMSPKKGTILVGNTSSNHGFSGDMLVFRGVKSDMIPKPWQSWGQVAQ